MISICPFTYVLVTRNSLASSLYTELFFYDTHKNESLPVSERSPYLLVIMMGQKKIEEICSYVGQ